MPCSSPKIPPQLERNALVEDILQEVKTGVLGTRRNTYDVLHCDVDRTVELCSLLQEIDDLENYSDVLKNWWFDHQMHDFTEVIRSLVNIPTVEGRNTFIDSLSSHEERVVYKVHHLLKDIL